MKPTPALIVVLSFMPASVSAFAMDPRVETVLGRLAKETP